MASNKVIVAVAPTDGMASKQANPNLPTQPEEIAESVQRSFTLARKFEPAVGHALGPTMSSVSVAGVPSRGTSRGSPLPAGGWITTAQFRPPSSRSSRR